MNLKQILPLTLSCIMGITTALDANEIHAFIGTYTQGTSKGIYSTTLDLETGTLGPVSLAAEATDPSFLALAPDLKSLYAINESGGRLRAFAIGPNHALRPLNDLPTDAGYPADLGVDPSGSMVIGAIYGGGAVVGFPILKDGSLGKRSVLVRHSGKSVNVSRQEAPHAHGVTFSRDGRFLVIPDLGIDQVRVYAVDAANAQIKPAPRDHLAIEPGSGPRHAVFSKDGKFLYVINELFSTITVASFNARDGALTTRQTVSTLPADFAGQSTTAEIALHPNGNYVYGSNRGHDSVAQFSRDRKSGKLTLLGITPTGGKNPRNFAITPDGRWLIAANQDSNSLFVFRIDGTSGALTVASGPVSVPRPVCVRFLSYP